MKTMHSARCLACVMDGVSQRLDINKRIRRPGPHPMMGDGMCFALYDGDKGPGRTFFPDMMVRSPDHRGATGFRA